MENTVIIDTNLIFSALISSSSAIRDTLLESHLTFYAPNFIIAELFKHQTRMLKLTKLSDVEFYTFFNGIIENIRFVPLDFISTESRQQAYDLCKNIDLKDTPFVALAIELNAPLWTGDKKLKTGISPKGFTHFFEPQI